MIRNGIRTPDIRLSAECADSSSANFLEMFLKKNNVYYHFVDKKETVHTKDAAAVSGIPLEKITKSLVFLDNNVPFMLVLRGTDKVDVEKLKKLGFKSPRIVPFAEAHKYSGYEPGGTCPVNLKVKMRIIIDEEVMKSEKIYNGGGSRDKLVELKTEDMRKLNNADIFDIREMKV